VFPYQPPSNFSGFLDIKNERANLVGGRLGKLKNIYFKIQSRESIRWQSFVQAGLG
jgi:hypothetical protein